MINLEWCGFIRSYYLPGKNVKDRVWQLMDNYTIFYFAFQKDKHQPADFWETVQGTPLYNTWCGLAFERVCMQHVEQIKTLYGKQQYIRNGQGGEERRVLHAAA